MRRAKNGRKKITRNHFNVGKNVVVVVRKDVVVLFSHLCTRADSPHIGFKMTGGSIDWLTPITFALMLRLLLTIPLDYYWICYHFIPLLICHRISFFHFLHHVTFFWLFNNNFQCVSEDFGWFSAQQRIKKYSFFLFIDVTFLVKSILQ